MQLQYSNDDDDCPSFLVQRGSHFLLSVVDRHRLSRENDELTSLSQLFVLQKKIHQERIYIKENFKKQNKTRPGDTMKRYVGG